MVDAQRFFEDRQRIADRQGATQQRDFLGKVHKLRQRAEHDGAPIQSRGALPERLGLSGRRYSGQIRRVGYSLHGCGAEQLFIDTERFGKRGVRARLARTAGAA